MRLLVAALALGLAPAARADECRGIVNGTEVLIDPDAVAAPDAGLLERFRLGTGEFVRDPLNRSAPRCDSATLITFMAGIEGLTPDEATGYCLAADGSGEGWLLVPGERDYRGRCDRTVCERVDLAAADALAVTERLTDLTRGTPTDGVTGETTASGALLLSGRTGLIGALLDKAAGAVGAVVVASPMALGAAAVTVLGVGGTLYLCAG